MTDLKRLKRVQELDSYAEMVGTIAEIEYLLGCQEYWNLAAEALSGQEQVEELKAQYRFEMDDTRRILAENLELDRNPRPSLKTRLASMLLEAMDRKDLEGC